MSLGVREETQKKGQQNLRWEIVARFRQVTHITVLLEKRKWIIKGAEFGLNRQDWATSLNIPGRVYLHRCGPWRKLKELSKLLTLLAARPSPLPFQTPPDQLRFARFLQSHHLLRAPDPCKYRLKCISPPFTPF